MDELISLIIFVVFIIASIASSIANKARERREAQERRQRRPVRPEDLPPETRRQLYGGGGVRRAQHRSAPPGPSGTEIEWVEEGPEEEAEAPRPATPVPRPVVMRGGGPPVIPRAPAPEQVEYELERRREEARRRREEQERRQALEEARRRLELERRKRIEESRRQPARRPEAPSIAESPPLGRMAEMPSPEMAGGPIPPIGETPQRRAPSEGAAAGRFFSSRDDLRRAIILREIIGPPRALDDPFPAPEARL